MKSIPSIETQKKMHAFFMKTSAPRILEEMKEKEMAEQCSNESTITSSETMEQ